MTMIAPLAYLDTGTPIDAPSDVPALLLVHGDFSAGTYTWSRQIQGLRDLFRIISVDRAGHGRTKARPGRYTFRGDAEDLIATLDALGVRRAHLVGHSYGALAVLEATRLGPDRASSLHLVEAPYLALLPEDHDVNRLAAEAGAAKRLSDETPRGEIAFAFFKAVIGEEGAERLRRHKAWPMLVKDADRLVREEFAGEYPAEAIHSLPAVPTFVYAGGMSHPGLQQVCRRLAELLDAPLETFPEAGHDVPKSAVAFTEILAHHIQQAPSTWPDRR